ncbi:2-polyprenyl-6-methoxyphenol hydroxylase [Nonomuraea solani]|uniref:2-polyprenyl-6-methoxyphenol hydroxylase n=1 Tax=Nonomuraea solani TaxID=1144553 RepID=A0A1H6CQZ8_9ACTN|nr:FAD-dependent monooxygenase [Nonomuraea solani]SEG75422.1 2-polyprenyl-6-methoxyphenol hydroxylase [Nonomuraea solani]
MTSTPTRGRALVVGLGIAGIATAVRLRQIGWEPVLVERAPTRRSGGYFIMLFGTGVASARRLGVLDSIGDRSGPQAVTYTINRAGRRRPGISPAGIGGPAAPRALLRPDVERGLFEALPDDVEIRYSTVPTRIVEDPEGVEVTLNDTVTERFDLVVGADGMRSTVRELAFGPGPYLHPLNYMIGATILERPVDGFGLSEGLTLAEPGRSAWAFPFTDHAPSLLFSYRTSDIDAEFARAPIDSIRAAFGPEPAGPILESLFTRYEQASDALFDSVQQVKMPSWHTRRVVLIGDAAWCLTLYSGMGASTGIAGAELLGTVLQRHDIPEALGAWEAQMRPFIDTHQAAALSERFIFTPHNFKEYLMRAGMMRLMSSPIVRKAMGKVMGGSVGGVPGGKGMRAKNIDIAAA